MPDFSYGLSVLVTLSLFSMLTLPAANADAADGARVFLVVNDQLRRDNPFIYGAPRPGPRMTRPPKRFFVAPGEQPRRRANPPDKFFVTPKTPPTYHQKSPAFRYGCFQPCRKEGRSAAFCQRHCMVHRP